MLSVRTKFVGTVTIFAISLLFGALVARAQSVSGTQANPSGPFSASLERRRAEQDLRALPARLRQKREQNFNDPKVLEQMNEDFIKLQTIRAEMAKTFALGGLIASVYLRESSEDIKRRALRLRTTLALFGEPQDIEVGLVRSPTIESLNDRAFQLCLEISRFTENPMFRANGVITAKQVAEAARDLHKVIALAEALQKESSRVR